MLRRIRFVRQSGLTTKALRGTTLFPIPPGVGHGSRG